MFRRNFGRIGKSITPETKLTITPKMGIVGLNDIAYNASNISSLAATGGTITIDGNYKVHTFTSSGTFTPSITGTVDYLVVAGGGGGSGDGNTTGG